MEYSLILKALILSEAVLKSEFDIVQSLFLVNQKFEQNLLKAHQVDFVILLIEIDRDLLAVFPFSIVANQ